ncbi:hypothetical protein [Oceanibium sediminis]|uniref:hypothetical protein n=1 Tax=Oceanibium sediminis TaxID=2026339 RepID=UPI000DD4DAB5|nr:hypothetical protein [Oceanibium sediminis]
MSRPRLILHIGLRKTGTSAIQAYLARNRAALRLMGVRYPKALLVGPECDGGPKHQRVAEAISGGEELAAQMREAVAQRARLSRVTVLSAEELSAPDPAIPAALAPLAEEFDCRVVVYLRRQDEWALSVYRQAVMEGDARTAQGLQAWLARPELEPWLNHDAMLGHWESAFGAKAMSVRLYPHDLPIIPSFLDAAGLPASAALLPGRGARVNESPGLEAVGAALAALGAPEGALDFDQGARDDLLERLGPHNNAVRQRYFPWKSTLFGVS